MTVSTWKRLLTLLNVAALLGMAGTVYAFFGHRGSMAQPYEPPSFKLDDATGGPRPAKIDAIAHVLGRPFEPVAAKEGPAAEKAEPETIQTAIQRLGTIIDAVAFEGPYTRVYPTITFKFEADGKEKIINLGEALVTRKKGPLEIPYQYQFIGCKLDRSDPDVVYFWFRMKVGEERKEWLKWRAVPHGDGRKYVAAGDDTRLFEPSIKGSNGVFPADLDPASIAIELPDDPEAAAGGAAADAEKDGTGRAEPAGAEPEGPTEAGTEEVVAVEEPVPYDQPRLFDRAGRDATFEPTEDGLAHLNRNYKKIIGDVQAATYRDRKTGEPKGVRIRRIKKRSAARQFGIMEEDVILSVNGRRVTTQSQTVSVVRDEVKNRKKTKLVVKILRAGREITQTYDTRDPKARQAARDYSRGRR